MNWSNILIACKLANWIFWRQSHDIIKRFQNLFSFTQQLYFQALLKRTSKIHKGAWIIISTWFIIFSLKINKQKDEYVDTHIQFPNLSLWIPLSTGPFHAVSLFLTDLNSSGHHYLRWSYHIISSDSFLAYLKSPNFLTLVARYVPHPLIT